MKLKDKLLPTLLVLPIVPNATRKHKKFFDSSSFAVEVNELAKLDPLACYAAGVSHTPGLLLRASGVGPLLLERFSGPTALEHFNSPFGSLRPDLHIRPSRGVDCCRSTFPSLFLPRAAPSFQTQPSIFFTHRSLTESESNLFCHRGGKRIASSPTSVLYEVKVLFLNMDLPSLIIAEAGEGPMPCLLGLVEKEFYSFSKMLSVKYPDSEFPLVAGSRFKRDPLSRASVDEHRSSFNQAAWWTLTFKSQDELTQLFLMLKAKLIYNSPFMRSSESVEKKLARKWI